MDAKLYHGLSRRELYELLWAKPASEVAKKIGVSVTALTSACRRLRIPKPTKAERRRLAEGRKVRRPALLSFGLKELAESAEEERWYSTLNSRTRTWLARAKMESLPQALQLELHSKIPPVIRRELGQFQYTEQLNAGIDPRGPLSSEGIQQRLTNGGLLFGGLRPGEPWAFLSLAYVRDGWVLCARRGAVFLRGFEQEKDYMARLTGFEKVYVPPIRRPQCWFGVLQLTGFEKMEEDVDLSREIFGLDHRSLLSVLDAYERVTRSSEDRGVLRINYSKQDRACDLSGKLIPARFPSIEIGDVGPVGTTISLEGFYDVLAMLTGDGKTGTKMISALEEAGVDAAVWSMIRLRRDIWPWSPVTYRWYIDFKVASWRHPRPPAKAP
jgi:hypothetical protein